MVSHVVNSLTFIGSTWIFLVLIWICLVVFSAYISCDRFRKKSKVKLIYGKI